MDDDKVTEIRTEMVSLTRELTQAPTAKDRISAFEDEHFGKDAVRVNGELERGIGSPFAKMDPADAKQYAALEVLVTAEAALAAARDALLAAETEFERASAAVG